MRYLVWLLISASCATSPEAPLSSATLTVNPAAHSARAQPGVVTLAGASLHKWTVTFATIEGCTGDTSASVEIETLASQTAIPTGVIQLRADQTDAGTLPSAYLSYMASPLVSGAITINSASEGFVTGSLSSMLTVGGVATDVSGTFSAPTCP